MSQELHNQLNIEREKEKQKGETRTLIIHKSDCFLTISQDLKVQINVPIDLPDKEIPDNAKTLVALAHLINEENPLLTEMIMHKWNELVDQFNHIKGK